jgi:hypothetical protein
VTEPTNFNCVVFDKDSVLADTRHRRWAAPEGHAKTIRRNWTKYAELCEGDAPVQGSVALARLLAPTHTIVILTGAPEVPSVVGATQRWLHKHAIPYHAIFFMPEEDERDSAIWKGEMLELLKVQGYHLRLMIDDWFKVADSAAESNVPFLQVCPPGGPSMGDHDNPDLRTGEFPLILKQDS